MFEFFIIFLLLCVGFGSLYRVMYFNLTITELLYACCAMWFLGFLTFLGIHEPPKELVGINILTYHITTYMSHMAIQGEALVPYQIAIPMCLVLAGGAVLYFRDIIKKFDL